MIRRRRVIKLGGSLLDLEDLAARFRQWLAGQAAAVNVLIAGGGRLADVVREADRRHRLGEVAAHWLAVQAMALNSEMLRALLAEAADCRSAAELAARESPCLCILDPWTWLKNEEPWQQGCALPANWRVTSDSIAARLAHGLDAELVLLKSALPERSATGAPATIAAAATAGYVDAYFPTAAAGLVTVRCVDLRNHHFREMALGA